METVERARVSITARSLSHEHRERLRVQMVADEHGRVVTPRALAEGAQRRRGAWSTTSSWMSVAV